MTGTRMSLREQTECTENIAELTFLRCLYLNTHSSRMVCAIAILPSLLSRVNSMLRDTNISTSEICTELSTSYQCLDISYFHKVVRFI